MFSMFVVFFSRTEGRRRRVRRFTPACRFADSRNPRSHTLARVPFAMLPASDDAPGVREHIDRLEASSREEAFGSSSAPPATRGGGAVSSEKEDASGPETPDGSAPHPPPIVPAPTPPYLPDTRPATVAASREADAREGEGKELEAGTPPPAGWFEVSKRDPARLPAQTRDTRRDPLVDRDEEPGWMRFLFLGDAGRRSFPFGRGVPSKLRPLLAWVPVALRVPQALFSLLAFAVVASMTHDQTCGKVQSVENNATATQTASALAKLVTKRMCLPGRSFTHFACLEFLVVANASSFVWCLCFFFGDLLCLGKVRLGRDIVAKTTTTEQALKRAQNLSVPLVAFFGDLSQCFLTLTSATATFGFLSGANDLDAGYCGLVGEKGWCDRMAAAAGFSMCAFLVFLPSVFMNAANEVGPW